MLANAEGICQAITSALPATWNLVELSYAATNFGSYAAAASPSIASFFTKAQGPATPHEPSADPGLTACNAGPSFSKADARHGPQAQSLSNASLQGPDRQQPAAPAQPAGGQNLDSANAFALSNAASDKMRDVSVCWSPSSCLSRGSQTMAASAEVPQPEKQVRSAGSRDKTTHEQLQAHAGCKRKAEEGSPDISYESVGPSACSALQSSTAHARCQLEGSHDCAKLPDPIRSSAVHDGVLPFAEHSRTFPAIGVQQTIPHPQQLPHAVTANAPVGSTEAMAMPVSESWSHAQLEEQRSILRDIELRKLAGLPSKKAASLTKSKVQRPQHGIPQRSQQTLLSSKLFQKNCK